MLWFIQKEFVATIIIQVDFEVTPAVRHNTEAGYRGDSDEMEFPEEGFCFQSLWRGSGTMGSVTMSVMILISMQTCRQRPPSVWEHSHNPHVMRRDCKTDVAFARRVGH